jgi:thiol:disulfide interchange protein
MVIDGLQAAPSGPVAAVLRLDMTDGREQGIAMVALPAAASAEAARPAGAGIFPLALGGALLGGLLLNLMPCVFPILSLKALSLARSADNPGEARAEALGYAVGATGIVLGLGGLLLGLRGAGATVGWAFQLQSPAVVAVLLLLVVAIATNLAGLYELPSFSLGGTAQRGFVGGMATGSLAAFIATPCTGPFMAGALGMALVLPPAEALAIFGGLGVGLSAPFLLIGFVGPVRGWLPRPGRWMVTLRRGLSVPMFATALGLAWLLGQQAGVSGMTIGLAGALILGVALWWCGLRQSEGLFLAPPLIAVVSAIALVLVFFATPPRLPTADPRPGPDLSFGEARLQQLLAQHRPVFVFATADWCLTCKVNEATSIDAPSVVDAFSRANVAVMRADWTKSDPEVSRLLAEHHRAGVPLYLWYSTTGEVSELPQVLAPALLVNLARKRSDPPDA